MNRERRLAKNALILGAGTLLPRLFGFVTLPLYTAVLTQAEYGTFDLLTALATLLVPAVTLQIQSAVFRFLVGEKNEGKINAILTTALCFVVPISLVTSIALFLCLSGISMQARLWIALYAFADMYAQTLRQALRGLGQTREYAVSAIGASALTVLLAVPALLVLRLGLEGVMMSLCLSRAASLLYMARSSRLTARIRPDLYSKTLLAAMLRYALPMTPNALSLWMIRTSDRLVILAAMGIEAAALYAVANKIPQLVELAQSAFTMAWHESAALSQSDADARAYYSRMFDLQLRLLAAMTALVAGASPLLFRVLIRGAYGDAYAQTPILLLAMFFYGLASFYGGIYVAQKKTASVAISTALAAAVNLLACVALIGSMSLYAATLSTLIAYALLAVYRAIHVQRLCRLAYNGKTIAGCFSALILVCAAFYMPGAVFQTVNMAFSVVFAVWILRRLLARWPGKGYTTGRQASGTEVR